MSIGMTSVYRNILLDHNSASSSYSLLTMDSLSGIIVLLFFHFPFFSLFSVWILIGIGLLPSSLLTKLLLKVYFNVEDPSEMQLTSYSKPSISLHGIKLPLNLLKFYSSTILFLYDSMDIERERKLLRILQGCS